MNYTMLNAGQVLAPVLPVEKNNANQSVLRGSIAEQGTSVAQLPMSACHDRCGFPKLPQATGHCPGCTLAIHANVGFMMKRQDYTGDLAGKPPKISSIRDLIWEF